MRRFDIKGYWDVRGGEDAHKAICDDAHPQAAFRASGERDIQLVLRGASMPSFDALNRFR